MADFPATVYTHQSGVLGAFIRRGQDKSFGPVSRFHHAASGNYIVCDSRLEDKEELADRLCIARTRLANVSEGELILRAWLRWKNQCLDQLTGDFSFALWDAQQRRLWCVRDRLGTIGFYFISRPDYFAFASDSEWLTRLPGIDGRPNRLAVASYLEPSFNLQPDRKTFRDEISGLRPGECITVVPGSRHRMSTWWRHEAVAEQAPGSHEQVAARVRELLGDAVEKRVMDGVDPAMLLSGGIDSMSLAGIFKAGTLKLPRVTTYSATCDFANQSAENRSIHLLAEALAGGSNFIDLKTSPEPGFIAELARLAWTAAHPVDNALLVQSLCCLAASRAGERVLLHGTVGDLVTTVPDLYTATMLRTCGWGLAITESLAAAKNNVFLRHRSAPAIMLHSLLSACTGQRIKNVVRRMVRKPADFTLADSILHKDLQHEAGLHVQQRLEAAQPGHSSGSLNLPLIGASLSGLPNLGRRFGITLRDAWADLPLLDFYSSLPLHYKVKSGWTKYPVRAAFAGTFDAPVVWRTDKEHLGWRFTHALMNHQRKWVEAVLHDGRDELDGLINPRQLKHLQSVCSADRFEAPQQALFQLVTLILWLRRPNSVTIE